MTQLLRTSAHRRPADPSHGEPTQRAALVNQTHAAPTASGHRVAYLTIAFITAAVFGPYTPIPGMRTEQLAVYGVFAVSILFFRWSRLRATRHAAIIVFLLAIQAVIAIINPVGNVGGFLPGRSALAGLDNLLLPITVLAIVWILASTGADPERLLEVTCRVIVVAMSINAAIALASAIYDLRPVLSRFWSTNPTGVSTADRAATMGRFSGIFNQPAEAGELYSIALLAALYLYRDRALAFATTTVLVVVGGALTVSKIFLLGGLPIAVWQLFRTSGGRTRRNISLAVFGLVVALVAIYSGVVPSWQGGQSIMGLVNPAGNSDMVDLYTAGRFGGSSMVPEITGVVLSTSPFFGFGVAGLAYPYDNGWLEALIISGFTGVFIYTVLLATLVAAWWHRRKDFTPARSGFTGGVVLVLIGASLGLPALTANRVATVAWIMIGLLLLSPGRKPNSAAQTGSSDHMPGDAEPGASSVRSW